MSVTVIGLGLAGSEAAWQLAERGVQVVAWEMRPVSNTPAHRTDRCAELVCSNSFRSDELSTGPGLLKAELRAAGSLILRVAQECRVAAGAAFAVDREHFSEGVTRAILSHPNITVRRGEIDAIPEEGAGPVLIATGPLTSDRLFDAIQRRIGSKACFFFDAIAPRIMSDSIDFSRGFWASRYGKGEGEDYFNCPMSEQEYTAFWEALRTAETVQPHLPGEAKLRFFEGCLPVEEMARRGVETLAHGPMKPVGLRPGPADRNGSAGSGIHAVVQLRKDNREGTILGMVGFQTCLTYPEQRRVLRMIPALERAAFAQLGSIHMNRYIHAPSCLNASLQMMTDPRIFFAGQICGVEGYIESCATGFAAAVQIARISAGLPPAPFPCDTAIGALCRTVRDPARALNFQPQNINFGILGGDPRAPREARSARALRSLAQYLAAQDPRSLAASAEVTS